VEEHPILEHLTRVFGVLSVCVAYAKSHVGAISRQKGKNMANLDDTATRTTKRIRWIARIWGAVVIAFTLLFLTGYAVNWVTTGVADPYAMEDYPPIENLIPLTLVVSVAGLGIAWRREGLGGAINIGFYLANMAVHRWMISPRPYPWVLIPIVTTPGILFLVCWWRSSKGTIPQSDAGGAPPGA